MIWLGFVRAPAVWVVWICDLCWVVTTKASPCNHTIGPSWGYHIIWPAADTINGGLGAPQRGHQPQPLVFVGCLLLKYIQPAILDMSNQSVRRIQTYVWCVEWHLVGGRVSMGGVMGQWKCGAPKKMRRHFEKWLGNARLCTLLAESKVSPRFVLLGFFC